VQLSTGGDETRTVGVLAAAAACCCCCCCACVPAPHSTPATNATSCASEPTTVWKPKVDCPPSPPMSDYAGLNSKAKSNLAWAY
jgi:hypothetical protein